MEAFKTRFLVPWALAIALLLPGRAWGPNPPFPVVKDDLVQWKFDQPSKVLTIGDLHADPYALLQILSHRGLINKLGDWTGGKSHLVLMGDFVDRGPNSRGLLDIVIRLEEQAKAAGGKVHGLVGNHDVMVLQGDLRYANPSDVQGYAEFIDTPEAKKVNNAYPFPSKEKSAMAAAFRGDSKYADWLRRQNSVIQIGKKVYVHAGLTQWPLTVTPGEVNSTVREWIRHFQGKGPRPSRDTEWVLKEPHSPFWNRGQAFDAGMDAKMLKYLADAGVTKMDQTTVEKILTHLNAEQLVIAHSYTASKRIETHYNGKVVRVDTNISSGYGGNLSAMEENRSGKVTFFDEIPRPAGGAFFNGLCQAVHLQTL